MSQRSTRSLARDDRIVWDRFAETWTTLVRGNDPFRPYVIYPALHRLLGHVAHRRVLDLGCGEGQVARWMAARGAHVTALDHSMALLRHAQTTEARGDITYVHGTASNLSRFASGHFDVVVASMSLMDIYCVRRTIREVARVLAPGGHFVFAILHPCFNPNLGGWWPRRAKQPRFFTMDEYFGERRLLQRWPLRHLNAYNVAMYHRPLSYYTEVLHAVGLGIRRLVEPRPTIAAVKRFPILAPAARVPYFIVMDVAQV
ncbi:MAG: class I SAM-dependent methyltransferase [Deltaproteobacteria bacterium]|nr:class I SAM-dependent methyltransferase [Deltaproteobacteria bacterium]